MAAKAPINENQSEIGPTIKRGSITSLSVYEITDFELTIFEQGGTSSVALNFCIFLYSVAVSGIVVLTTVDLSKNNKLYLVFFTISIIGVVLGTYMLITWWRTHTSVSGVCKKVRERLKQD